MSYQVIRTITNIISSAVVLAVYLFHVSSRYQAGLLPVDDLSSWARVMLIFIAIGIAAAIVIQIIFHILFSIGIAMKESIANGSCNEQEIEKTIQLEMVEDEMNKLIELKSLRVGYVFAGIGFVASLIYLSLNYPAMVMLNILFVSFSASGILDGFARLYYYKRGI